MLKTEESKAKKTKVSPKDLHPWCAHPALHHWQKACCQSDLHRKTEFTPFLMEKHHIYTLVKSNNASYRINKVLPKVQHFFYVPGWISPCSSSEIRQSLTAPPQASPAQHWGRAVLCSAQNPLQSAVLNLVVVCHTHHQKLQSIRLRGTSSTI